MIYKCLKCEYETTIKSNLNRHVRMKHSDDKPTHICEICDCVYTTHQSLRRHMITKHSEEQQAANVVIDDRNGAVTTSNVSSTAGNVSIETTDVSIADILERTTRYQCDRCKKTFTRKYTLGVHANICKGVSNPLECHLCHKVFALRATKSRHLKTCKGQEAINSTSQQATTINNIANQHNGDNITTNNTTNNNITNNQNIVINFGGSSDQIQFLVDKINNERLRQSMISEDEATVLIEFARMLMEEPANRCVRKTNLRSDYSSVHKGDGAWETRTDARVFPKLVANIANSASDYFHSNKRALSVNRRRFEDQQRMHDYVADGGYCADDDQAAEVKRTYREVLSEAKTMAYDNDGKKKRNDC